MIIPTNVFIMEWIKQDEEVLSYWHRRNLEDPPRGTLWPDHLKGEEADEYWLETISDYDWDQLQKGKEGFKIRLIERSDELGPKIKKKKKKKKKKLKVQSNQ